MNFRQSKITFDSKYCCHYCDHYGKTLVLYSELKTIRPSTITAKKEEREATSTPRGCDLEADLKRQHNTACKVTDPSKSKLKSKSKPTSKPKSPAYPYFKEVPKISLVNSAAFMLICNQLKMELLFMSYKEVGPEKPDASLSCNHVTVTEEDKVDLFTIPSEYHEFMDLFRKKKADELPTHGPYNHTIPLIPRSKPPYEWVHRMLPVELKEARKYLQEHLKKGSIHHSQSEYGMLVVFTRKKDSSLQFCIDYWGLNKLTVKNRYSLPLIGELLDRISRAIVLSKFDIRNGYNQLRMAPSEKEKTTFCCHYGLFEYTVMPFSLCNASNTFQHYMNDTFYEFLDKFLVIYLDDFLVYSDNLKEHKKHIRQLLEQMQKAELYLKPSKCEFHKEEVEFLGFIVSKNGTRMDPANVNSITSWPVLKSVYDIHMFLGLANFYQRFIKGFSHIIALIMKLLKKEGVKDFR